MIGIEEKREKIDNIIDWKHNQLKMKIFYDTWY